MLESPSEASSRVSPSVLVSSTLAFILVGVHCYSYDGAYFRSFISNRSEMNGVILKHTDLEQNSGFVLDRALYASQLSPIFLVDLCYAIDLPARLFYEQHNRSLFKITITAGTVNLKKMFGLAIE